jgi:CelD/BcsL family acetyltransferase involved in cellulose biosynthesis
MHAGILAPLATATLGCAPKNEGESGMTLGVSVGRVDPEDLHTLAADWDSLASLRANGAFLGIEWFAAWAAAYRPRQLRYVRIATPEGGVVGLGLIEHVTFRRWRFAGWPVTTVRGLLCQPGRKGEVWSAFAAWLMAHSREWSMVDAEGLDGLSLLGSLRVSSDPVAWFGVELPESFDAFLDRQPAKRRREIRRKLRVAEKAGVTARVVEPPEYAVTLDRFVSLHGTRALSKGEVHEHVDERLARMLTEFGRRDPASLVLHVLEHEERVVAVKVAMLSGDTAHDYNIGWDPDLATLRLGTVACIVELRHMIERGIRRLDMGPGDTLTKRELGGELHERYSARLWSSAYRGRALRLAASGRERAREVAWLREAVQRARKRAARRQVA